MSVKFWAAALASAALDLKVKRVMGEELPENVIYNRGFAANRLEKKPVTVACTSVFLSVLLPWLFFAEKKAKPGIAEGLIMGGALSNSLERVFKGRVTDYIPLGKYVYNLADMAIYAGILGRITGSVFHK